MDLKQIGDLAAQKMLHHGREPSIYAGNADLVDIYFMLGALAEATVIAIGARPAAQVSSATRKAKTTKAKVKTKSRKR